MFLPVFCIFQTCDRDMGRNKVNATGQKVKRAHKQADEVKERRKVYLPRTTAEVWGKLTPEQRTATCTLIRRFAEGQSVTIDNAAMGCILTGLSDMYEPVPAPNTTTTTSSMGPIEGDAIESLKNYADNGEEISDFELSTEEMQYIIDEEAERRQREEAEREEQRRRIREEQERERKRCEEHIATYISSKEYRVKHLHRLYRRAEETGDASARKVLKQTAKRQALFWDMLPGWTEDHWGKRVRVFRWPEEFAIDRHGGGWIEEDERWYEWCWRTEALYGNTHTSDHGWMH